MQSQDAVHIQMWLADRYGPFSCQGTNIIFTKQQPQNKQTPNKTKHTTP